jgi:hypothetical protein
MKKGKFIQILKQLTAREQSRFRKYVQSPFFNKHKEVTALYEYIIGFAPEFDHDKLQKQIIFQDVIGLDCEFDDKHFNNITSYLLELLCDFIAYLEQEKNPFQQKLYIIEGLRKRNLVKHITSPIRQHQMLQQRYPYKDTQIYFEQYLYHNGLDALFLMKSSRAPDENLQLESDSLDLFYLSSKLKLACDMASRNMVIKANYNCYLIEELLQYMEQSNSKYLDYPSIGLYYKVLKMLTETEEVSYFNLKNSLEAEVQYFSREEAKLIYDYAENYCIRQINTGNRHYYQEFLDLYKAQLRAEVLFKDGYLSEHDYKNIVTAGVRTKDYEWTESFIHKNKNKLKKGIRENAFIYNLAAFYYATSQYSKALRSLHAVEFTNVTYHLGAKDIQLKSYYELGESEAFYALVNAFRIYVKRNKELPEAKKELYFNYLKITKKLEKLKEKRDFISKDKFKKERSALGKEIAETKDLANSDWVESVFLGLGA